MWFRFVPLGLLHHSSDIFHPDWGRNTTASTLWWTAHFSIFLPQGFCKCFSSCHPATKSCGFSFCCDDLWPGKRCALKWLGFASEWSAQSREARTEQGEVRSTGTRINGTWAVFFRRERSERFWGWQQKKKRKSTKHSRCLIYRSSTECGKGSYNVKWNIAPFCACLTVPGKWAEKSITASGCLSKSLIRLGSRAKCFPSQAAP